MCAAVENVHHRDGEPVARNAAQETVEGDAQLVRRCLAAGDGDREDRVRAQLGLVLGAVRRDHCLVDRIDVGSVHAAKRVVDDGVDVVDRLGNALAAETLLVAVAKFERLELARGRAARSRASADGAACKHNFRFNGRVAAGIDDLSAVNFDDFHIDFLSK